MGLLNHPSCLSICNNRLYTVVAFYPHVECVNEPSMIFGVKYTCLNKPFAESGVHATMFSEPQSSLTKQGFGYIEHSIHSKIRFALAEQSLCRMDGP